MARQAPRCPRCARSARSAAGPSRAVAEPPQKTHIYAPCSRVWRPEVQNRGVHRAALPLEALGEGPSCPFQPLGAAGRPWPVATHFSPCLSACPPACLSVSLCVCRNDTSLDAGPSGTIQGVSSRDLKLHSICKDFNQIQHDSGACHACVGRGHFYTYHEPPGKPLPWFPHHSVGEPSPRQVG